MLRHVSPQESVHNFAKDLDKFRGDRPVDRLVCNAAAAGPWWGRVESWVGGAIYQTRGDLMAMVNGEELGFPVVFPSNQPTC